MLLNCDSDHLFFNDDRAPCPSVDTALFVDGFLQQEDSESHR